MSGRSSCGPAVMWDALSWRLCARTLGVLDLLFPVLLQQTPRGETKSLTSCSGSSWRVWVQSDEPFLTLMVICVFFILFFVMILTVWLQITYILANKFFFSYFIMYVYFILGTTVLPLMTFRTKIFPLKSIENCINNLIKSNKMFIDFHISFNCSGFTGFIRHGFE